MSTRVLSARNRQWVLREAAPPAFLAQMRGYHPIVATLLYQRGLHDREQVDAFLNMEYGKGVHNPFSMRGMEAAARRIATAIAEQEPIAVYGDFDTDGVTAVTLLVQAITAMGGDIRPYIPHRLREGYGLNTEAIDQLANEGVRLLVTVDCGISNVAEVAHAKSHNIDVIVTDHHTPPEQLPDALVVVNPKQPGESYPFPQLVGVGIAFKLVQGLTKLGLRPPGLTRDQLLDVVALGTVADMGALTGENRVLVKYGLDAINQTRRPGLQALITAAGLAQGRITSGDIGFMLGPRLNAAGRLEDARLAYQLLLADDAAVAKTLAAELNDANSRRQQVTRDVQAAALQHARERGKLDNRIVVLDDESYPAGIVGLVAARLVDELARPVLLIGHDERGSRGSARSVPGFNIVEALATCADLLERYGGHSAAAGFTIQNEHIPALEARLLAYAADRLPSNPTLTLDVDADVPLASLSWELLAQLGA
ncbi:MAG TPA: single-stranded-DNA-specific exonuclease RecJ, partial [Roseiflexaceae bacterium]|nr:single-stranded-DNA-specific exonuclease RecJ [Roseiflexaceae bacterium]